MYVVLGRTSRANSATLGQGSGLMVSLVILEGLLLFGLEFYISLIKA